MKKTTIIFKFIFLCILCLSIPSCNKTRSGKKESNKNILLPSVTGAAYDVLVVGQRSIWKNENGKVLFDILNEDMPGFPQSEPLFNISYTSEKDFVSIFKPVRNILKFEIDENLYTQGRVKFAKDKWATPQAIISITAPSEEEFVSIVKEKKKEIINYFIEAEHNRAISFYTKYCNNNFRMLIEKKFGIGMIIPKHIEYKSNDKDETFLWMNDGNINITQNLVIYTYPYKDSTDLTLNKIISIRDSVMKKHIEGSIKGSYMTTEHRFEQTFELMTDKNGNTVAEVRGLWCMENDAMGGPFVSRTIYEEGKDRIIVAEAFVYGPNQKKRNIFRQLEAMLYSIKTK